MKAEDLLSDPVIQAMLNERNATVARLTAERDDLVRVLKLVEEYMECSNYATDCDYELAQVRAVLKRVRHGEAQDGR